ncbi:DUF805 domain-containing protein [Streptomyces sp. NBC_01538]|uniref:DUF805 domain-containing protein n=1 Tax=Streptomyces sp. NBC_01538 TaxID=2903897 RepID=UPI00386ED699
MNYYLDVLKKYVVFSGRARRQEFWMFALLNIIVSIVLMIVDSFIGAQIFGTVYALAVLLPSLAVGVRRLHDTGRSGWWILLGLFLLIGWVVLVVFYCIEGEKGDNKYGSDPKLAPSHV